MRLKREGREEVGVSCGVVTVVRSSWSPFQPIFPQRRGSRARRTRPLTCLRRPRGLQPSALSPPRLLRAPRLHCRFLTPAAPAASPRATSAFAARRPRSSALSLVVGFSTATLSRPDSPLLCGLPQTPSSSHSLPGQVRKFGVRVALLEPSFSA